MFDAYQDSITTSSYPDVSNCFACECDYFYWVSDDSCKIWCNGVNLEVGGLLMVGGKPVASTKCSRAVLRYLIW